MKILNLVDPRKSDIVYKIQKFPDGQQNIVIAPYEAIQAKIEEDRMFVEPVTIKSRLNNWLNLELIVCAVTALRELGVEEIHLYTPYIVGGRSDRKFEEGTNNYIKDVIAPIINSLNFKTVTCIDPHSDVLEACIKGFKKRDNISLLDFFFISKYKTTSKDIHNNFILVSPDAGASKKIYKLAEQIGYTGDIITCSKDRDVDGNLTKTVVTNIADYNATGKDFVIIDDICDGGATFINIAKEIKANIGSYYKQHIYLIVTHGIMSKGLKELSQYFDGIYCTNSVRDISNTEFNGVNTVNFGNLVKQLDVY